MVLLVRLRLGMGTRANVRTKLGRMADTHDIELCVRRLGADAPAIRLVLFWRRLVLVNVANLLRLLSE